MQSRTGEAEECGGGEGGGRANNKQQIGIRNEMQQCGIAQKWLASDGGGGGVTEEEAQSTYIPRVPQCLYPRANWDPPLSRSRVCSPLPEPKGGGVTHSPVGDGGVPIRIT
jgi:hypothetical protein